MPHSLALSLFCSVCLCPTVSLSHSCCVLINACLFTCAVYPLMEFACRDMTDYVHISQLICNSKCVSVCVSASLSVCVDVLRAFASNSVPKHNFSLLCPRKQRQSCCILSQEHIHVCIYRFMSMQMPRVVCYTTKGLGLTKHISERRLRAELR